MSGALLHQANGAITNRPSNAPKTPLHAVSRVIVVESASVPRRCINPNVHAWRLSVHGLRDRLCNQSFAVFVWALRI